MLAVFTVDSLLDNTDDDGLTTLREAVALANADADADTIDFDLALFDDGPQTIALAEVDEVTTVNGKSAFHVTTSVTIVGPGADLLTLDASPLDATPEVIDGLGARHFHLQDLAPGFVDVSLSGLTLRGGDTENLGGAIRSNVFLTLDDVTFAGNHVSGGSSADGGAVYQGGRTLTIVNSRFLSNSSENQGGAIFAGASTVTISDSLLEGNLADDEGGAIHINSPLTINDTIIQNNTSDRDGGGLYLDDADATITGSTIARNATGVFGHGGGIAMSNGALSLVDSVVSENDAGSDGNSADGGGIYLVNANLEVHNSTIGDNGAGNDGGGLYFRGNGTELTIVESSIIDNWAGGDGGGIELSFPSQAPLVFTGNRVDGNRAEGDGGGVHLKKSLGPEYVFAGSSFTNNRGNNGGGLSLNLSTDRTARVVDSVISGNRANSNGGGLFVSGVSANTGLVEVERTTITNNAADDDANNSGVGDGVFVQAGELNIAGSIVASNDSRNGLAPDVGLQFGASLTATHSLIGTNAGNGLASAPVGSPDAEGNLVGEGASGRIDPRLAPLGLYGGPHLTHALLPDSPAVDAGDPTAIANMDGLPEFDLRGAPFMRIFDGDGDSTARVDMGSFELQNSPLASPLVVDTLADAADGDYSAGEFSLREAIALGNSNLGDFEIRFDPQLAGGTIVLNDGELSIVRDMTIVGPGADRLTIDAAAPTTGPPPQHRAFRVSDGSPDVLANVAISGLTLTGGNVTSGSERAGGAIYAEENLTLTDVLVVGNTADLGGGVYLIGGVALTIANSRFELNEGAAIYADGGAVALDGVAVHDNLASNFPNPFGVGSGAGVHVRNGSLEINNSTFTDNRAEEQFGQFGATGGGAVLAVDSSANVTGSTFAGNDYRTFGIGNEQGGGGAIGAFAMDPFGPPTYTLSVVDSQFTDNTTGLFSGFNQAPGGAIATFGLAGVTLERVNVTGSIGLHGGAAHLDAAEVLIVDSLFDDNQARDRDGLGGGVAVQSPSLTVNRSTFSNNFASGQFLSDGAGGGLYYTALWSGSDFETTPTANVNITDSQFTDNTAYSGGGAMFDFAAAADSLSLEIAGATFSGNVILADDQRDPGGGGIAIVGSEQMFEPTDAESYTISNSRIENNAAVRFVGETPIYGRADGGGIFVRLNDTVDQPRTVDIVDTRISGNTTGGQGGGLWTYQADLTLDGAQVIGNTSDGNGGGVYADRSALAIDSSRFESNQATNGAGGGIYHRSNFAQPTTRFENSQFIANTAVNPGGGVYSQSNLDLANVAVIDNTSTLSIGGGVYSSGELSVVGSTFAGNQAGDNGGGAYAQTIDLLQSTFSGNSAGTASSGFGGGFYSRSFRPGDFIKHSTIVDNHADERFGAFRHASSSNGIRHSIIAGNTHGNDQPSDLSTQTPFVFNSFIGHNAGSSLTETGLGASDANGNIVGGDAGGAIDPLLEPLGQYGGPTPTRPPQVDSPVIEAGDPSFDDATLPFDQRGAPYVRVVDGNDPDDIAIDIGAAERQPHPADFNDDDNVNGADFLAWQLSFGTTTDADDLDNWQLTFGTVDPPAAPAVAAAVQAPVVGNANLVDGALAAALLETHSRAALAPSRGNAVAEQNRVESVDAYFATFSDRARSLPRSAVATEADELPTRKKPPVTLIGAEDLSIDWRRFT